MADTVIQPPSIVFSLLIFFLCVNLGVVMCIRPNGQLHVQLRPAGEVIFVPLATVRATPSLMEMRLMPLTREIVSFFIQLLTAATEEMEKVEGFDEDLLRDQLIKALQLKAARAVLLHPDCLHLTLISPLTDEDSQSSTTIHNSSPCSITTVARIACLVIFSVRD